MRETTRAYETAPILTRWRSRKTGREHHMDPSRRHKHDGVGGVGKQGDPAEASTIAPRSLGASLKRSVAVPASARPAKAGPTNYRGTGA
jgi:hypothetical protein